jgi:hypothetical protein
VTIRVQGRDWHKWQGRVTALPQTDEKIIPKPLTNKGGGPVPVQPGTQTPVSQQYLIDVEIINPDGAIVPGSMGKANFHCRWRTAAWWVYHTLSDTFNLGLQ